MHVLRKRIEPEAPGPSTPVAPPAPLPDPSPMEVDGVTLASPTSVAPPPPLPEVQNEGEQAGQQEEGQEERQEEQQPPLPTGSEDLIKPTEPPQDSTTGRKCFYGLRKVSLTFEENTRMLIFGKLLDIAVSSLNQIKSKMFT